MLTRNTCLVIVSRYGAQGREVLLLDKARGPNEGYQVPPGGKVGQGETPLEAAVRELREEAGLSAVTVRSLGLVTQEEPPQHWTLHLVAVEAQGELTGSCEGQPAWHPAVCRERWRLPPLDRALWPVLLEALDREAWVDVFACHDAEGALRTFRHRFFQGGKAASPAEGMGKF